MQQLTQVLALVTVVLAGAGCDRPPVAKIFNNTGKTLQISVNGGAQQTAQTGGMWEGHFHQLENAPKTAKGPLVVAEAGTIKWVYEVPMYADPNTGSLEMSGRSYLYQIEPDGKIYIAEGLVQYLNWTKAVTQFPPQPPGFPVKPQ